MAFSDPKQSKDAFADCLKVRRELAAIDPQDTWAGVELALALAHAGETAEAEKVAGRLLQQAGTDRLVLDNVACTLSIVSSVTTDQGTAGRCRDQAFGVLRDLVKAGWKDRGALEADWDFDFLRADPRFKDILKALPNPTEAVPPRPAP
jgi:hypothetical protein